MRGGKGGTVNKFKKAGIVSLATFIFLLAASAVALALGYVRLEHESYGWLFLIVGVILLILSGLVAFVVRGNTAVNLACFAANAVALGFCIRTWYFFRGLENNFVTMLLICLACVAYLWVFFALCLIPFISRHIKAFFFIWLAISAVAYILVVIFTNTTFVSTFGYYMLVVAAFTYAMVSGSHNLKELIRALTLSAYSVFAVAVIVAVIIISEDGDLGLDCVADIFSGAPDGKGKEKQNQKEEGFLKKE